MDSDTATPAALYFEDESFTLAGEGHEIEAILWLSFYETDASVNFAVYNYLMAEYTHDFKGSTAEDVQEFIAGIEAEYSVQIPALYGEKVSKFLSLKDKAFGVRTMLDKKSTYCEGCSDTNSNDLEAFYFPPLNAEETASLAVHWNFGCYGGEILAGGTEDKVFVRKVRKMLRNAIDTAQVKSAADEVQDFLDKLAKVAPTGR